MFKIMERLQSKYILMYGKIMKIKSQPIPSIMAILTSIVHNSFVLFKKD